MAKRLLSTALICLLWVLPALAAGLAFLPGASRDRAIADPPSPDLLTWDLPEGLLIADRRGPAGQVRHGEAFTPRHDDAAWFLVHRPHLARGRGEAADPAAFGHVHLTSSVGWVVEVPRTRLDDFFAAAFRLNRLDVSPVSERAPAPAATTSPAATTIDPALKAAFVDSLDLDAYRQLVREITGDLPFWHDGASHTVATRYYNTAGNALVADYLAGILAGYGYDVELDGFYVNGHLCRNVVATRTGATAPDEIVVVGGHYDSTSPQAGTLAPGAEDNASGTGLVMEIARISAARTFDRTVQFVLFDAEEQGLHGSYHFVDESYQAGRDIIAAITADMVAFYQDSYGVIIEGQTAWEWLMTIMADNVAAHTGIASSKTYHSWGSDHVPFQQYGIAAFLAIDMDWSDYSYYHTTLDAWPRIEDTAHLGHQITRAAAATLADVAGLQPESTSAPDLPAPAVRLAARPNPFNPRTTLSFTLPAAGSGELAVFDLTGRRVAVPAAGDFPAGRHTVDWDGLDGDGRAVPSGVYLGRLRTTAGSAQVKLNLVR